MRYSIFAMAAAASFASAQSSPLASASASPSGTEVPIGGECTPGGTPCALGANCYAVNSMQITRCGNFQSSCKNDAQCAFNTCNLSDGLCNGFLESSAASTTVQTLPTGPAFIPAPPSTVTAPAGSLALGAECNAQAAENQCANGVNCYASNSGLIPRCGNFNSSCKDDSQCAYNTCDGGLCRGFKELTTTLNGAPVPVATATGGAASHVGNGTVVATGGAMPSTTGAAEFTGAANVNAAGGMLAAAFGAVAWAL